MALGPRARAAWKHGVGVREALAGDLIRPAEWMLVLPELPQVAQDLALRLGHHRVVGTLGLGEIGQVGFKRSGRARCGPQRRQVLGRHDGVGQQRLPIERPSQLEEAGERLLRGGTSSGRCRPVSAAQAGGGSPIRVMEPLLVRFLGRKVRCAHSGEGMRWARSQDQEDANRPPKDRAAAGEGPEAGTAARSRGAPAPGTSAAKNLADQASRTHSTLPPPPLTKASR